MSINQLTASWLVIGVALHGIAHLLSAYFLLKNPKEWKKIEKENDFLNIEEEGEEEDEIF